MSTVSCELFFSEPEPQSSLVGRSGRPELEKVVFSHPRLESPLGSVRGKAIGASRAASGSFQWTAGVQALAMLLLQGAICPRQAILTGEKGSEAASLDYALSREPLWLQEMFGVSKDGELIAKFLFSRSNPERKRPGPVSVALREGQINSIRVIVNNQELLSAQQKESLLSRLFGSGVNSRVLSEPATATPVIQSSERGLLVRDLLLDAYLHELSNMLPLGDVFGNSRVEKRLQALRTHPGLKKYLDKDVSFRATIDAELSPRERLGIGACERTLRQVIEANGGFSIALPPALAGSLAVFSVLRKHRNYPIDADFRFAYSAEIAQRILSGALSETHDACVMAIAVAAREGLLSSKTKSEFKPFMLMPQTSHQVVRFGKTQGWNGEYYFMSELPGTGAVYFDELAARQELSSKGSKVFHAEPDEITSIFKASPDNARAILWFPHFHLQTALNQCAVLDETKDSLSHQGTVLLIHERFLTMPLFPRALNIAIRDAWLELASDRDKITWAAENLVHNAEYVRFLVRCGGLHYLS